MAFNTVAKFLVPDLRYSRLLHRVVIMAHHTAKTHYRKFETNISRKRLCGLSPYFHIHVSVSDLYIPRSVCLFCCRKICGPILGIYKSLTDTGM
jgi:hypothetical protein